MARLIIIKRRLVAAFKQESTWRGIIAIATAAGVQLSPDLQAHIIAVGLSLIGAINVAKRD